MKVKVLSMAEVLAMAEGMPQPTNEAKMQVADAVMALAEELGGFERFCTHQMLTMPSDELVAVADEADKLTGRLRELMGEYSVQAYVLAMTGVLARVVGQVAELQAVVVANEAIHHD